MSHNIRTKLAILMAATCCAWRAPMCCAQFEGGGDGPTLGYSQSVVVENCEFSQEVIEVVSGSAAARLFARFKAELQDGLGIAAHPSVSLSFVNAKIGPRGKLGVLEVFAQIDPNDELAKKLWAAARDELEQSLRTLQQSVVDDERRTYDRQRAQLERQLQDYRQQLENIIAVKEASPSPPPPQQQAQQQLDAALAQLRELDLNSVGVTARHEAIEARIDELRALAGKSDDDPIVGELQKIVSIREQQVAKFHALNDAGQQVASANYLNQAEADLASARIELLKAQRAAAEQTTGTALRELNDELSKLIVKDHELQAMHHAVSKVTQELARRVSESIRSDIESWAMEQRLRRLQARQGVVEGQLADLENQPRADVSEIKITPLASKLLSAGDAAKNNKGNATSR